MVLERSSLELSSSSRMVILKHHRVSTTEVHAPGSWPTRSLLPRKDPSWEWSHLGHHGTNAHVYLASTVRFMTARSCPPHLILGDPSKISFILGMVALEVTPYSVISLTKGSSPSSKGTCLHTLVVAFLKVPDGLIRGSLILFYLYPFDKSVFLLRRPSNIDLRSFVNLRSSINFGVSTSGPRPHIILDLTSSLNLGSSTSCRPQSHVVR
ncbi:hypothetical protein CRG98_012686 [Punica granatum]|uniref:Uncharacterized protein n=1 Tax=Punica granatum TaxID=22663 RepID=A0A2I0KFG9_PUNGR|nr:hypothetical protein CRG98_012686 [Punica granatum]